MTHSARTAERAGANALIADRIWFITGGASGLGAAASRALAARGGLIVVMDLNQENGDAMVKELSMPLPSTSPQAPKVGSSSTESSSSGGAIFVSCDVTEEKDVQDAIKAADERWPGKRIGGCICAAGISIPGFTVQRDGEPYSLDRFSTIIKINLIGTYNVNRLVASRIVRTLPSDFSADSESAQDQGVIINVSSNSYQEGQAGQAAYAASKGGVASLTLPLARDLSRFGIRVVAIAPSLFVTPMSERLSQKAKDNLLRSTEFPRRFGKPDEFAAFVVHAIENSYMNGNTYRLDGATVMSSGRL